MTPSDTPTVTGLRPPPDLAELRELLAKATPGPWAIEVTTDWHGDEYNVSAPGESCLMGDTPYYPYAPDEATARLIVAAVNNLPALLDRIDALTQERADLLHDLSRLRASLMTAEDAATAAEAARQRAEQAAEEMGRLLSEDAIPVFEDVLAEENIDKSECAAVEGADLCGSIWCHPAGCIVDKLRRARAALQSDPPKTDTPPRSGASEEQQP